MSTALRGPVSPGAGETLLVKAAQGPIPVKVVRRRGLRKSKLEVTAKGARLITALSIPLPRLQAFANQHADWLARHVAQCVPQVAPLEPFVTSRLPANGHLWPVTWVESSQPSVTFDGSGWTLAVPRGPRALAVARGLIRTQWEQIVRQGLSADLGICTAAIGKAPVRVDVKPVESMWGRLSGKDHVLLDLALALAPPQARRYVWIHELCHLAERNHSPRFWAWVTRFCPAWKVHREWFRREGGTIKAQVRGLLAL